MKKQLISGEWLTVERLYIYPRIFILLYLFIFVLWVVMSTGNVDMLGRPLGSDFISYYAASQLILDDQAALVYDVLTHYNTEKLAVGQDFVGIYPFTYPPMFLLMVAPIATLPYIVALLLWQGLTLVFFIFMIWKISHSKDAVVLAIAFPAVFITILHGQNAFITAGLMAGIVYFLDRRPVLCGLMIGLLTIKPHLGLLIPIILLISRRWLVFSAAAGFSLLFAILSYWVFGLETWQAFLNSTDLAIRMIQEGLVPYYKFQSLFAGIRLMGGSLMLAYGLHVLLALTTIAVVIIVWRRPLVDMHLKSAALIIGSLMIPPYLFDYDLIILAVAITCLAIYGIKHGFRSGLISLLAMAWVAPFLVRSLNNAIPLPWTTILLTTLLYQMVMMVRDVRIE